MQAAGADRIRAEREGEYQNGGGFEVRLGGIRGWLDIVVMR